MSRKLLFIAVIWFGSNSLLAQVYPVLHDADGKRIGHVVSLESTPFGDRLVQLLSPKGYVVGMSFARDPSLAGLVDLPGHKAAKMFGTDDCSDEPIILPMQTVSLHGQLDSSDNVDILKVNADYARFKDGALRNYHWGDLIELGDEVYFAPLDAVQSVMYVKAYRLVPGGCHQIDRCESANYRWFPNFLVFENGVVQPEEYCPAYQDPAQPFFKVRGFRLGQLELNDPVITGFQSIAYKMPFSIQYIDIETVLNDGFEAQE